MGSTPPTISTFITNLYHEIVIPILWVLISIEFIVFFWGLVEFIRNADSDEGRAKGKRHIIWGIAGVFVTGSVFGLTRIMIDTLGVGQDTTIPGNEVPELQQERER